MGRAVQKKRLIDQSTVNSLSGQTGLEDTDNEEQADGAAAHMSTRLGQRTGAAVQILSSDDEDQRDTPEHGDQERGDQEHGDGHGMIERPPDKQADDHVARVST